MAVLARSCSLLLVLRLELSTQLTIPLLIGSNNAGEVIVTGKRTGPVDDRHLGAWEGVV